MADEEIVKTLECCMKIDCQNCPTYVTNNQSCKGIQIFDVVTLINRQQAEIERLTTLAELGKMRANDYREMRDKLKKANAEIERLNKEVDRLSQCVLYHEGQIVDAVKDFAERLKEEFRVNTDNNGDINSCFVPIIIDNLVNQIIESEE